MKTPLVFAWGLTFFRLALGQLEKLHSKDIVQPQPLCQLTNRVEVFRSRHPDIHLVQ